MNKEAEISVKLGEERLGLERLDFGHQGFMIRYGMYQAQATKDQVKKLRNALNKLRYL